MDQAKHLHYRRCQLFRDVCKMGFHYTDVNGVCKGRLQTTKFNSLLNFLAIQYLPNQVFMGDAHYACITIQSNMDRC